MSWVIRIPSSIIVIYNVNSFVQILEGIVELLIYNACID